MPESADQKAIRIATYAFNRQRAILKTAADNLAQALDHHEESEEEASPIQEQIFKDLLSESIEQHNDMLSLFKKLGRTPIGDAELNAAGADSEAATKAFQEVRNRAMLLFASIEKAKKEAQDGGRNGGGGGGGAAELPKVHTAFKPNRLAGNASILEFEKWRKQYLAYYDLSGFDKYPLHAVHTTFYTCIDNDLERKIRARVRDDTPVLGAGSLMERLENLIIAMNPISVRRLELFLARQRQGQKFSDTIAVIEQLASAADVANITAEGLIAHLCIAACQDTTLRKEILKDNTEPTLVAIRRITDNYEAATTTSKKIERAGNHGGSAHNTARGRAQSAPRQQGRGRSKVRRSGSIHNAKGNGQGNKPPDGICWRCGDSDHKAPDCPKDKNHLTCSKCRKKGHVAKVCRSKQSRPQSRPQSRSPKRRRSPSPYKRGKVHAVQFTKNEKRSHSFPQK